MNDKEELLKGCDKKIDENGSCWYISSRGNKRYCKSCKKKIEELEKTK